MPNCIAPPFLKRRFLFLGCSRLGPLFCHLWREIRPEGTLFSAAQACGPARAGRIGERMGRLGFLASVGPTGA
jgi:hypothetical protein